MLFPQTWTNGSVFTVGTPPPGPMICILLLVAFVANICYNLFLHPLASYKGPWYCRATRLWYSFHACRGTLTYRLVEIHEKYGDIVRIAPDELSYTRTDAWQPIYGRISTKARDGSHQSKYYLKDPIFNTGLFADNDILMSAENDAHRAQREPINHAFTRKGIVAQEAGWASCFDLATAKLKEHLGKKQMGTINLSLWLENMVLDMSALFVAGQDVGAVESWKTVHPVWATLRRYIPFLPVYVQLLRLPRLFTFALLEAVPMLFPYDVLSGLPCIDSLVRESVARGEEGTDLVHCVISQAGLNVKLDHDMIVKRSAFLLLASSTTSSWMGSLWFCLLSNPEILAAATAEVRGHFNREQDINPTSAQSLTYMSACLRESLRLSPPISGTLTRIVPSGGAVICGEFVPEKSVVGINQWSALHIGRNFAKPDEYHPERWLGAAEFVGDDLEAWKPWGFGPRMCPAKELATLQSHYMAARMLWNLDMGSNIESMGGSNSPGYIVPKRESLFAHVKIHNE